MLSNFLLLPKNFPSRYLITSGHTLFPRADNGSNRRTPNRRVEGGGKEKNETERVIKLFTPDQLPFVCIRHVLTTSTKSPISNLLAYAIVLRNKWVCAGKRSPIGPPRASLSVIPLTISYVILHTTYFACKRAVSVARNKEKTKTHNRERVSVKACRLTKRRRSGEQQQPNLNDDCHGNVLQYIQYIQYVYCIIYTYNIYLTISY